VLHPTLEKVREREFRKANTKKRVKVGSPQVPI
jgi:hypothetical protein